MMLKCCPTPKIVHIWGKTTTWEATRFNIKAQPPMLGRRACYQGFTWSSKNCNMFYPNVAKTRIFTTIFVKLCLKKTKKKNLIYKSYGGPCYGCRSLVPNGVGWQPRWQEPPFLGEQGPRLLETAVGRLGSTCAQPFYLIQPPDILPLWI